MTTPGAADVYSACARPLRGERERRPTPGLVSVIIPALNPGRWFAEQLEALHHQLYPHRWELLIADNGSIDGTIALARSWQGRLPLRMVSASAHPGANAARNLAATQAGGDLLVFCDADDVAHPGWLAALAEAARTHDLVGGRLDEETLNAANAAAKRPRMPTNHLPVALNFLPFAVAANFAVWADVFTRLGGFDEGFAYGNEDVELCFRAQTSGFDLGYAPDAVMAYRHRQRASDLFRQFYRYGANEPLLYQRYRHLGMPRPGAGEVLRRWGRIVLDAPLAAATARRGEWLLEAGFSAGRLTSAIRHRIAYL